MGIGRSGIGGAVSPALKSGINKIKAKFAIGQKGRQGTVISNPVFSRDSSGRLQFSFEEERYFMGTKSVTIGQGNIPGTYTTYTTTGYIIPNGQSSKIVQLQTKKKSERPLTQQEKQKFRRQGYTVI